MGDIGREGIERRWERHLAMRDATIDWVEGVPSAAVSISGSRARGARSPTVTVVTAARRACADRKCARRSRRADSRSAADMASSARRPFASATWATTRSKDSALPARLRGRDRRAGRAPALRARLGASVLPAAEGGGHESEYRRRGRGESSGESERSHCDERCAAPARGSFIVRVRGEKSLRQSADSVRGDGGKTRGEPVQGGNRHQMNAVFTAPPTAVVHSSIGDRSRAFFARITKSDSSPVVLWSSVFISACPLDSSKSLYARPTHSRGTAQRKRRNFLDTGQKTGFDGQQTAELLREHDQEDKAMTRFYSSLLRWSRQIPSLVLYLRKFRRFEVSPFKGLQQRAVDESLESSAPGETMLRPRSLPPRPTRHRRGQVPAWDESPESTCCAGSSWF